MTILEFIKALEEFRTKCTTLDFNQFYELPLVFDEGDGLDLRHLDDLMSVSLGSEPSKLLALAIRADWSKEGSWQEPSASRGLSRGH